MKFELENEIFNGTDEITIVIRKNGEVKVCESKEEATTLVIQGKARFPKDSKLNYLISGQPGTILTSYNVRRWIMAQMAGLVEGVRYYNGIRSIEKLILNQGTNSNGYFRLNKQVKVLINEIEVLAKMEKNPYAKQDFVIRSKFFSLDECKRFLEDTLSLTRKKLVKSKSYRMTERERIESVIKTVNEKLHAKPSRENLEHLSCLLDDLKYVDTLSDQIYVDGFEFSEKNKTAVLYNLDKLMKKINVAKNYNELLEVIIEAKRTKRFPTDLKYSNLLYNYRRQKMTSCFLDMFLKAGVYYSSCNAILTRNQEGIIPVFGDNFMHDMTIKELNSYVLYDCSLELIQIFENETGIYVFEK